ncbi:MAG: DsrE/DsrF/DrsH-like family protein [Spirochaetia bacterium]|nr:DsrE/DsrF/DrsH-like family protein [Spirochaetia bacterium]
MATQKKLMMIASRGSLDWAYPPFILGSTAAALDMEVSIFFTFYGLTLLLKDLKPKVTPSGNPAMPMKMPFGPKWFQGLNWPMPNMIINNVPFFDSFVTAMMKKTFKNKGVASIPELRDICVEAGVKMIACQMTMDVFGFSKHDFIDGIEFAGAATALEIGSESDMQFFL